MALKTFVKISQVNNLSDARYCAGMGVDLMGFNIDPNDPDHIGSAKFSEIAEWISGVEYVGEFNTNNIDLIKSTIDKYPIGYIQFEHAELSNAIHSLGYSTIFKTGIRDFESTDILDSIRYVADKVDYVLAEFMNFDKDGVQEKFLSDITGVASVLIGGNVSKDHIQFIVDNYPIKGIELKGGDEIKPGFKDYDELADILEDLEIED